VFATWNIPIGWLQLDRAVIGMEILRLYGSLA
jgi:hypothetical protein